MWSSCSEAEGTAIDAAATIFSNTAGGKDVAWCVAKLLQTISRNIKSSKQNAHRKSRSIVSA